MRPTVTAYAGSLIPNHNSPEAGLLRLLRKKRKRTGANYEWAELIKHIYEVDPLECPDCGGKLRLVAFVTHPSTIRHVLSQIGLPTDLLTLVAARDPPEQLDFTEVIYWEDIDLLLVCDGPEDTFREIVDPPHRDEIDNPHIEEAYVEPDYQDFGAPDPSNWEPC